MDTLDELPGIGRITAQELIGRRALVAVGNQVLTIASHLLLDPQARFADLGADVHDRLPPNAEPAS